MMNDIVQNFPRPGRVEWIGIAEASGAPLRSVQSAEVNLGTGIAGEHHAKSGKPSQRQVTLIQHEHLEVVRALAGLAELTPDRLRRNIVVSGINLVAMKDRCFRVGNVLLQGTGPCVPCSLMEHNLGAGGFNAMRGHGGITAIVREAGAIRVGDAVEFAADVASEEATDD